MISIYYGREEQGLKTVWEHDRAGSYEFDILWVYRDSEGTLRALRDEGCSCPIPFEDYSADDGRPIHDIETFETILDEWVGNNTSFRHVDVETKQEAMRAVKKALDCPGSGEK